VRSGRETNLEMHGVRNESAKNSSKFHSSSTITKNVIVVSPNLTIILDITNNE
jgi:hypothetical protein